MMSNATIQTTCPYCGVGCGVTAVIDNECFTVSGDTQHPSNFGKLCSKGSALAETVDLKSRLLQPEIYNQPANWSEALGLVADTFARTIKEHGADAVAFYVSGQLLTEDYYVANKLMKGFMGSSNIDTNSRLCMSSAVAGYKRAFGADIVPNCYEDYEQANLILLIGSNTAWCHPISYQRIRAAKEANPDLKIVVIDPRKTASCDIADLHLPIKLGSDTHLFNGLLQYLKQHQGLDNDYINHYTEGFDEALQAVASTDINTVAAACELDTTDIEQFYQWFTETDKTLSLFSQGVNQSSSGTDKVNSIINCHLATGRIGKVGAGAFSLTGQPNAMGGREVGGLATQLAAHMDYSQPESIERVARFWGSDNIATETGYSAVDLFNAIDEGKIKAVWIMATNPVVSMPDADKVKRALKKCEFVVVSDCVAQTDTLALAHVKLPALGWSEKDGTVTNSERRISRQRAIFKPAGDAKADWWIITQVARRMGYEEAFHYHSSAEIFREHAALSGFENNQQYGLRAFDISAYANISDADYEALLPTQWPVNKANPNGTQRLLTDNQFFTASGKAQFIAINPRLPANLPNDEYPLVLNTGRIRDQWHTMTRTALAVKLNQHKSEPFVEISVADAQRYQLKDKQLAQISSAWGSMVARVVITDAIQAGNIFIPMHWTEQYASRGRVGALVNPAVDPISMQPESKHTPVKIIAYEAKWYGFVLSARELKFQYPDYLVKIKGEQFYRYELAGNSLPDNISEWIKNSLLSHKTAASEWQEYNDFSQELYRAAHITDNRLDAVVFISPKQSLPERHWLTSLFIKSQLDKSERLALLTGEAPLGVEDVGQIVCSCFNVGEKTILNAIKTHGLTTHQAVGNCLKAGTNCGSCVPEIKALLELNQST